VPPRTHPARPRALPSFAAGAPRPASPPRVLWCDAAALAVFVLRGRVHPSTIVAQRFDFVFEVVVRLLCLCPCLFLVSNCAHLLPTRY
jgi:hypothetical protein